MQTSAFELLHLHVQQIVLDLGWTQLYPIQEDAIRCFRENSSDIIITAPTSGGKTEAAFLPVLSHLVLKPAMRQRSIRVIAISPLKALINDQFTRLSLLCDPLGIPVHRWHGDVDMEAKRRIRDRPSGILFITPESIESLFINYPHQIPKIFHGLQYVIIDELHALLETERGMQVRSLLARLMAAIEHRPRCLALSATLGDPLAARLFLNPDNPTTVNIISDRSTARPIFVEVVSISPLTQNALGPKPFGKRNGKSDTLPLIADDLRSVFQDGSCLLFANSRRVVEELGNYLRDDCELAPNGEPVVALHHGSLAARLRKETESMLKSGIPTRALCTSSLELGIDVGTVEAVAQIDPTWSVSSLVQRLGRSGRRIGSTSRLRLYVRIPRAQKDPTLVDMLYPPLLQAVAMVNLLLAGWLEPAKPDRMHWSTLIHQILSILRETGGRTAPQLYELLCRQGPFRRIESSHFSTLLQNLYDRDLVDADSDGIIFLGLAGEQTVSAPGFYAAFCTPVELTVRCGARELGRLPVTESLKPGECLLLNGQRWIVDSIEWKTKSVWVSPTSIKQPTVFLGTGGEIHDRVFQEMRKLLLGKVEPAWLDETSVTLLRSARQTAQKVELNKSDLLELDGGLQWFPWVGTRTLRTLHLWAKHNNLHCAKDALSLTFTGVSGRELREHLAALAKNGVNAFKLAELLPNKQIERFDLYVEDSLLDQANAADRLDLASARQVAGRIEAGTRMPPSSLPQLSSPRWERPGLPE
jgi:ATP-dependent Lhr-like helicase